VASLSGSIDGISLTSDGEPASPGEASAELLRNGLARLLHLSRAQVDHRDPKQSERQRLMGQREFDRNNCEQRRNAKRDLEDSNGG
jgi:hypothetical protein